MCKLPENFNYNDIPVYYCTQCLSLRIMEVQGISGMNFCDECNSTDIAKANIFEWEKLYEQKYGFKFLEKNGREKRN